MSSPNDLLRELPSVDRLLAQVRTVPSFERYSREYVTRQCRLVLDELRLAIQSGRVPPSQDLEEAGIVARLAQKIDADGQAKLARVVNATGTILHTNLGRALLPKAAVRALSEAAEHTVNLEYDLKGGHRGRRELLIEELLRDLTGAEAATVVNNNAAAVLLALNTVAEGKEVIVSRGELIEIGGAFRLPEIMAKSGAILKEVGTTNRTHRDDYEKAINDRTALLLKVHTSNYSIVGFSSAVALPELAAIGARHRVPVMEDLGSGALVDLSRFGLPKEPVVAEQISLGADLITFSGDKLLGGPQAGLVVGKKVWVGQIVSNPLHRALRCGKLTIAALEATLRLYQQSGRLAEEIPTLNTFTRPIRDLEAIAELALPALQNALGDGFRLSLEDSTAQVGSGALPAEELPTKVIAIVHAQTNAQQIADRFRCASPPIIGRIHEDRFLLDLRTIFDPQDLVPRWAGRS
ncbi:MAG TPA: L-seryl-tRNA(Sec) selenium transferase [Vicinamibacterales bacterium]|jgi:L-seryl-tRNA(Ser) seleniumtransferase